MTILTRPLADGKISDLIALVRNATNIIETHYLKSTFSIVPSLDNLVPHPLDTAISPPALRDAVQLLEGASAQLCTTLARPSHTILNIPDILQDQPSGYHIKEIGEKAGINHEKLGRIMRLLATKHIFREDCFANNRLSLQLLSSNPLTNMVSFFIREHSDATLMLADVLADPEWGNSEAFEKSPWNKLTGFEGSMFQYWKAPDGAPDGASFGIGMGGWNDAIQTAAVLADFPWGRYPPGTTVNDFGGGIGNSAMELIKTYPNLQLKLQDLPDRIHQAEVEVWPKLLPSAIAEKRIEFKAFDFLADSPIEGYMIGPTMNVFKSFATYVQSLSLVPASLFVSSPAEELLNILTYKQLVHITDEYVLQHANHTDTSSSTFTNAPEPMLPNYGIGRIRQYNCDIAMMVIHNGKERTLDNFIDIASKADLQFVKLWCVGEMSMVELRA
ncbi:hypothetical protein C0989_002679 [Termitomyces sp. Mn162]|nr:hypothetical protein C0989_002679 [Termitomyces sp. Mn162]